MASLAGMTAAKLLPSVGWVPSAGDVAGCRPVAKAAFTGSPRSVRIICSGHQRSARLAVLARAAVETEGLVAEEASPAAESEIPAAEDATSAATEEAPAAAATSSTPRRGGKARPRKELKVKTEDLVVGLELTGKVRSVQSYGAFVDLGAFTDGLVHISELSNSYVGKVEDIVSAGQEVTVRIKEVDATRGRISLTMRDPNAPNLRRDAASNASEGEGSSSAGSDTSAASSGERKVAGRGRRAPRASETKKINLKVGEKVKGVVRKVAGFGAFVELPEGVEGLLHGSEIAAGGEGVSLDTLIRVGDEVEVRVLKVDRSRISLTMKEDVDISAFNTALSGTSSAPLEALNPFELAFRRANLIPEKAPEEEEKVEEVSAVEAEASAEEVVPVEEVVSEEEAVPEEEVAAEEPVVEAVAEAPAAESVEVAPVADAIVVEEAPAVEPTVAEEAPAVEPTVAEEAPAAVVEAEEEAVPTVAEEAPAAVVVEEAPAASATVVEETPAAAVVEEAPAAAAVVEEAPAAAAVVEEAPAAADVAEEAPVAAAAAAVVEAPVAAVEDVPAAAAVEEAPAPAPAAVETPAPVVAEAAAPPAPAAAPAGISASLVKQLREETGAGMMDCKKALGETSGDLDAARELLRKKGLASAEKKASRIASEGLVSSYVHSDRIGVLIEINCETDFVARGETFRALVEDLGMQVVACSSVEVVSVEDVPAELVAKERELEMGKEDLASKPQAVREKMVEGRLAKRLNELALLEQAYIKDDKITVKELVKQTVAALGENIQIRRFVRFNLGEGIAKKSADFAAEVAAASQVKAPAPAAPAAEEKPKEEEEEKKTVVVSAGAVKSLREATGAGMMDCKKALAACDNDLEKATEFLRKKGLASAEKKAGRVAAEGVVGSYIHDGRIGALVEVNCETDFVSRGETFKTLVEDLAMQVVACPAVQYVSTDEVDPAVVAKEREIEMGKEDLASKPEAVRAKIVEGRMAKRLNELALLEQPFIKDDKITVKELVKQTVAALGENIQVRRFERFTLGEGIEKRSNDFAAEVAAAAGVKSA